MVDAYYHRIYQQQYPLMIIEIHKPIRCLSKELTIHNVMISCHIGILKDQIVYRKISLKGI